MSLLFSKSEITKRGKGLTFDDVLLVPTRSEIRSRREPQLTSQLTKKIKIETPIISANMDTITESAMAEAMFNMGGLGILHRFVSIDEQLKFVHELKEKSVKPIAASIGVNAEDLPRAEALVKAGVSIITVDIAHGHSVHMIDLIKMLKDKFANIEIIAGNIATGEAALDLIEAGADAIKVGIGPGSMCTTRIITGCGVPQLSAIAMCAEAAAQSGVPIIADGGLRTSGDIVKALAAGAHTVMLGGMLAGTMESPGEIKLGKKHYRGMASRAAQVSWRGGVPEGMAPEGESTQVSVKGTVKDVINEICGGIRSGMSYINSTSLADLHSNARFIEMTASGATESRAHGVRSF